MMNKHITPGAFCNICRKNPATQILRIVSRKDGEPPPDTMYGFAALCIVCESNLAEELEYVIKARINKGAWHSKIKIR